MEIADVKIQKSKLKKKVKDLFNNFEIETGTKIDNISIQRYQGGSDKGKISSFNINLKL